MLIKVCGMREDRNLEDLKAVGPDFIGLIFYPKSSRNVNRTPTPTQKGDFGPAKKVGVFVKENVNEIKQVAKDFGLEYVQLHSGESPEFCREIKTAGLKIIKVFSISESADFAQTRAFEGIVDYFLFDTATQSYGGSGKKFKWELLKAYKGETPYLLSGGIGPEDVEEAVNLHLPLLAGIDINSKFETAPGIKDIKKAQKAIETTHKK